MKSIPFFPARQLWGWLIILLLLAACSSRAPASPEKTSAADLGGLPPEAYATLNSLEKVDDYPLYVMHFTGAYTGRNSGSTVPQGGSFACSLFAGLSEAGDRIYGRNFDWEFSPALLLFNDPPDGYASVSMVDLTFIGIDPDEARTLTDLPVAERKALLDAPSMPFDGMNEHGLAIGMAAVPDESTRSAEPSKPRIGSIGIIRQVLDHAKNVDEAIALFEQYQVDFSGGPPIHYLVADASGKAVLVEFYLGKMILLPNETPWHLATNHLRCTAEGDGGCPRYRILSERLTASGGQLDAQGAMQLLSEVAQSATQWSVVYNLTRGEVHVAVGTAYENVYPFQLDLVRP